MKLLLTGAFIYDRKQIQILKELGHELVLIKDETELLKIQVHDIEGVVCNALFLYNDIKKFTCLKFIQLTSAGMERVPLSFVEKEGIKLFNARGVYSTPIAEWVILSILQFYKKSLYFYQAQRAHHWEKRRDLLELTGKKAVILGAGSIGQEVAKKLKAFDVTTIGIDTRQTRHLFFDEMKGLESLEETLKEADFLIITLPFTEKTKHLMDAKRLSLLKENALLINVSRGGIVDEQALIRALQEKRILGAALDVFEEEPLGSMHPFWELENILISPHNSFVSDGIRERLFKLIVHHLKKDEEER